MATVPPQNTKTNREYKFYVPKTAWGQVFSVMAKDLENFKPTENGWVQAQGV